MFKKFLKSVFGDSSQREIKRFQPIVDQINALEPEMQAMPENGFVALTQEFRANLLATSDKVAQEIRELREAIDLEPDDDERRVLRRQLEQAMHDRDRREREVLDDILPRAFAAVREAAVRSISQRAFDTQLIGGIVLHEGRIAEMKTGEGKTLTATFPLYLNALTSRGVHLITPNDYLSKYGVQWMGPVYHMLGLSVAVIQSMGEDPSMGSFLFDPDYIAADDRYHHLRPVPRADAYKADILYGTNNEFGFDYLRDNMVQDLSRCVQRELYFAIVDEVDNILIDEARTPLIISGPAEESASEYKRFAGIAHSLKSGVDYEVDEKQRSVTINDEGITKVERTLNIDNLYSPDHAELTPYLENALKAKALFQRDRNYIVQNGQVIIVDEFTGRLMHGRRYSEGLHQAIEAKENVQVQRESLTLANITFQNYFRMYRRLAGMTGTAATEAEEFGKIYNLDVAVIPTHRPLIRADMSDVVYKTTEAKFEAVLNEIAERNAAQQPVLVGTLAIETSEMISRRLKRMGIKHEVLNAKQHEREAQIIAQAGRPGAVTIATNMAGRGVDILLGGNPEGSAREELRRKGYELEDVPEDIWNEVLDEATKACVADREIVLQAGGLHVLGTERYEARRIDNQLRGRAGRQGDPGSSRFFVSLEDDLLRLFGGERIQNLMNGLGVDDDVPIENSMVSRALENAQLRVEGRNFDVRKHLLEYDDVTNQQRQVIYDQRRLILTESNLRPIIEDILEDVLAGMVEQATKADEPEDWDLQTLHAEVDRMIHLPVSHSVASWEGLSPDEMAEQIIALAAKTYDQREEEMSAEVMRRIERLIMLSVIDRRWVRHLTSLDELREGIGLRAIGQRDPLVEYKREAFGLFDQLLSAIQTDIARFILNARLQERVKTPMSHAMHYSGATGGAAGSTAQPRRTSSDVGRNDPCPCGSGKKYKHCCLKEGLSPEEAAAKSRAKRT